MDNDLTQKKCLPCEGGMLPLSPEEGLKLLDQVPGWSFGDGSKSIICEYKFKDFKEAMIFVHKIADLAEEEGHHPDIHIFYNKVRLELITHAIGGLSENDFILAAKINTLNRDK